MDYQQMLTEIQKPENKLFKHVRCMMGGVENIKYSLHDKNNKVLFEVYGSEKGESAPSQFKNVVLINEKVQQFSLKQVCKLFTALSDRYSKEEQIKKMIVKVKQMDL